MKKQLLFFLTSILTIAAYSQIYFEKGYYIDNLDQKTDCLIKNIDWKNTPIYFKYKLSENTDTQKARINAVKEFGIYNTSKYIRSIVKIDRSSEVADKLSNVRNPIFKEEELFLKVLIEGKYSLYLYEDRSLRRYFYKKENAPIEQLIFKSYNKTSDNKIRKNNRFKQQLRNNFKCSTIKLGSLKNLKYEENSLVNIFTEYNKCNDSDFVNYQETEKESLFNLTIRPGLKYSSLKTQHSTTSSLDTDFGTKLGFRLGIEAECILSFNNNKWALLIEPTYQSYQLKDTKSNSSNNVDYKSIEIPVGVRHYMFLNKHSKLFISASHMFFDIPFDSKIGDLKIDPTGNLRLGFGYKYDNKFSGEIIYSSNRDLLWNDPVYSSDYQSVSVVIGYTIF